MWEGQKVHGPDEPPAPPPPHSVPLVRISETRSRSRSRDSGESKQLVVPTNSEDEDDSQQQEETIAQPLVKPHERLEPSVVPHERPDLMAERERIPHMPRKMPVDDDDDFRSHPQAASSGQQSTSVQDNVSSMPHLPFQNGENQDEEQENEADNQQEEQSQESDETQYSPAENDLYVMEDDSWWSYCSEDLRLSCMTCSFSCPSRLDRTLVDVASLETPAQVMSSLGLET